MRTTVTLDEDVARLVREAMHRDRRSFKETLNDALRRALSQAADDSPEPPFVVHARFMGMQPGLDPAGFNKLVDDLEAEDFLEETRRLEQEWSSQT